ncbi:hypothetical protein BCR32DRAFT_270264 [Anaeromyces robustus]|uniref:RING-CH-type domain-containing protein n=1 Tax=Anaeromyces robustus TaxID=1754192 RepID=A0A1Y1WX88_9FUNG|nr:hypothetical protein BCR32DRAFT_270264 [Anaeromyces robustus]|eukprot:ORX78062.1 hypothetical protein BCR32DRAFT_270264 [Anaeromyces robustus]
MNNNNDNTTEVKSKIDICNRQCWICLQTEYKDEINPISGKPDLVDPNEKWLTPCCCKGSTQYVHEECLINWIKLKRETDQKSKLRCPSCQTPYTILIPKKSLLQRLCIYVINKTDSLIKYIPSVIRYICIAYCIWEFSYIYGKFTLTSIFEKDFIEDNLKTQEAKIIIFRGFPLSLILTLFIPWEFSFLISAAIMHFTSDKELMISLVLLYAVSCNFFSSAVRLVLDYIYNLKLNLGLKNDEKTKEQRRLLKLSKSITFPNARVHINENFISPSSFTLKIHILEDVQNPMMQGNPQVLFVEYEKAIILLAVLKITCAKHKKCQSLPPYLSQDFLKEKAFSCTDLNHDISNVYDASLINNKNVSINNIIDKANDGSFKCILNNPRAKRYNDMIDSNINNKLKSSLRNIIVTNKENDFMKILNKQKSLYTKLTASNTVLNENSKQSRSPTKLKNVIDFDHSLSVNNLSPTKDKRIKNKDCLSSADLLNEPSTSNGKKKNLHLYSSNLEYNEIINNFKTNPLIFTTIGILLSSTFYDLCQLYYNYSKNIEKERLIVLNHQDISKKLNNYTSIN